MFFIFFIMDIPLYKIIIGATGSVATIKIPHLIKCLMDLPPCATKHQFKIYLIVTRAAKRFFKKEDLPLGVKLYDDKLGLKIWQQKGDPVLHVDLTKQAHMLVIAPLDANTMAKITQGLCDNLLTTLTRSWNLNKPVIFCPAMNSTMWQHPITFQQRAILKQWGFIEIPPVYKKLMCGTIGVGGMAEVDTIGLCDNLLTTAIRSWSLDKPVLFCPSMSTNMWAHPITADHISVMKQWGFIEIPPVNKKLMCGSVGMGGMADIKTIVNAIIKVANEDMIKTKQ